MAPKFKSIYDTPALKKLIRNNVKPKELAVELNTTRDRAKDLLRELPGDKHVTELRNNLEGLLRFFGDVVRSEFPLYRDQNLTLIQSQLKAYKAALDKLEK